MLLLTSLRKHKKMLHGQIVLQADISTSSNKLKIVNYVLKKKPHLFWLRWDWELTS